MPTIQYIYIPNKFKRRLAIHLNHNIELKACSSAAATIDWKNKKQKKSPNTHSEYTFTRSMKLYE